MARPLKNPKVDLAIRLAKYPAGDRHEIVMFANEIAGRGVLTRVEAIDGIAEVAQPVTQKRRRKVVPKRGKRSRAVEEATGTEQQIEDGEEVDRDVVETDDVEDAE